MTLSGRRVRAADVTGVSLAAAVARDDRRRMRRAADAKRYEEQTSRMFEETILEQRENQATSDATR